MLRAPERPILRINKSKHSCLDRPQRVNKAGVFIGSVQKISGVLEISHFRTLQLQLQLISDQRDEFGIRGFSLGVADCVSKEPLKGIQIASVPCHFDGVSDGPLDSAGGGLEGFCHLGVEYLSDGIGVPYGPPGSLAGCSRRTLQRLSANVDDLLLSLSSRNSLLYGFENMIAKQKWKVKLETNEHFRKFLSVFFVL